MATGLQLPARSVASLLAQIFGPSFFDDPRFGRGDLGRRSLVDLSREPAPSPWRESALTTRLLQSGESYAFILADAHIQEVLNLDRWGTLLGGDATKRMVDRALRLVAEVDDICPRWPLWPRGWPPPPPPPPWWREEMTSTQLFVFGARILAASELAEQGKVQDALAGLGENTLGLSTKG